MPTYILDHISLSTSWNEIVSDRNCREIQNILWSI